MKKIYPSIAFLFALITIAKAQNVSPYWSITGNTNATTTSKIGTVNSVPLRFVTKNFDRIRIDTFGRVGIGTISPLQLLHVAGNGTLSGNFGIGISTAAQKLHVVGNAAFTGNVGIGTNYPFYKLHIKGNANASQLCIDAYTTQSNTQPLIRLRNSSSVDLMHIHSDHITNVFIGLYAGRSNLSGTSGDGQYNTFIGSNAGYSNTSGRLNVANGYSALYANTTGYDNTAVGMNALYANTTGFANTAIGEGSLSQNTTGNYNVATGTGTLTVNNGSRNTANGHAALSRNIGNDNTALGYGAHSNNQTGFANVAVGTNALANTRGAAYNTAIGYYAGTNYDNGYNNVFVGASTDVNGVGYYNVIAIGQGTICTAPSQVTMGNGATNSYRAYNYWSNISDGRFKKNIQQNVPGLAFINKLTPVTYNLDATGLQNFLDNGREKVMTGKEKTMADIACREKEQIVQTGFIAQDVEKAAKETGFDFSGVDAAVNDKDVYGLRYAAFVVPLVKAVQELSKKQEEIDLLKQEVSELRELVMELKSQKINNTVVTNGNSYLKQSVPNPSGGFAIIGYNISGSNSGKITITDVKGSIVKTYNVAAGTGQLNITGNSLPAGIYNYSLYVNDKKIDTKQMIISR